MFDIIGKSEEIKKDTRKRIMDLHNYLWSSSSFKTFLESLASQHFDLNPIENLWAELKGCVQARQPTNLIHYLILAD